MNPEQWLSLKWNGGSTMSDRWLNQSKIIHPTEKDQPEHLQKERIVNINAPFLPSTPSCTSRFRFAPSR